MPTRCPASMRAWCADPDLPASMATLASAIFLSFSEQASRFSCLNLRAKCNGRTDGTCRLFTLVVWLVQWKSKRTPRQQKWGANCARLPALWDDHTSRWRPQFLLLASNAAGRMSCVTTGAMPLGVCAAMRERDGLLFICSPGHASTIGTV